MARSRWRSTSLAALTALLLPCALGLTASSAPAAFPGANGLFAIGTYEGIYTGSPGGGAPTKIAAVGGNGPYFSSDGTRILTTGPDGLYTMDVEGGDVVETGVKPDRGGGDGIPPGFGYLADGRILYVAGDPGNDRLDQLFTMDADGGDRRQLTRDSDTNVLKVSPIVSPDGETVYYRAFAFDTEESRIRAVDLATGNQREVLPGVDAVAYDISPDGRTLLYARVVSSGPNTTHLRDVVTGEDRVIPLGSVSFPRFSPDGTTIAYTRGFEIRGVDLDGANERTLYVFDTRDAEGRRPGIGVWAWQPDPGLTVTETTDEADADLDDGVCDADLVEGERQCTLRAAIENANQRPGADDIEFDVGAGGRQTIAVTQALPDLTGETLIDGSTQPGAEAGEPGIALDGADAGNADGLRVLGEGSTVRGLNLHGFERTGVVLAGDGGHALEGSWIGFEPDGSGYVRDGNGSGVDVRAAGVTIGGDTPAQRNVISANGNPDAAKAYFDGLDGEDVGQADLHDTFINLGTGIVISDGDASTVTISGNWIGPDPDGGRFGSGSGLTSTFGVMVGPQNGISTGIAIGGTTEQPGTGAGNVISGNLIGVLAVPDVATAGVVDGLEVRGNLIGADPDGTAGPGLGGLLGISVLDRVTGVDIAGNRIQGQVMGVSVKEEGVRIQRNLIGTPEDLESLVDELQGTAPSLGLHNILGVVLSDTERALLGGAADQGNQIVGNLIGALLGGRDSRDNAVLGNTFGLAEDPGEPVQDLDLADVGSAIGLFVVEGEDNDIGDAGGGNRFQRTGIGLLDLASERGHVQANRFHANVVGLLGLQADELLVGGSGAGQGNELTTNAIGAFLLGWSPTAKELAAAGVDGESPVGEDERELAFTAPASQGALNFVGGTTTATLDEQAVALGDPPGGATPARAARRRALGSTGVQVLGNRVGVLADGGEAPNYVGAWLAGTHSDLRVQDNTIAHNHGGGLWVGSPVALGSAVPEPTGVRLRTNRIFDNFSPGNSLPGIPALGFDLLEPKPEEIIGQAFGVTANDPGDADGGANGRQNTPEIATAVRQADGTVLVTGALAGRASTAYEIELFANERCNAFGSGEGEVPVGTVDVTTDAAGATAVSRAIALPAGMSRVSANATGPEGTSEFSACVAVTDAPPAPGPGPGPAPGPGPGPGPAPPPGPGTPAPAPAPPSDTKPPVGRAKSGGSARAGGPVTVAVSSSEDGTVTATGTIQTSGRRGTASAAARRITVRLGSRRSQIRAGQTLRLKLKPKGRKAIRALKRAVKRGTRATAVVKVTFSDRGGNRSTRTVRIRLRR